jgi:hypothetical protein
MRTRSRALAVGAIALLSVGALAAPASAANPPGNNGTVKVDSKEFDTLPDNEPHAGCVFQIDYYGFDEGALSATASFYLMQPNEDRLVYTETVFIGQDDNGGGGSAAGIDREQEVNLGDELLATGGDATTSYHVKLIVHAEGAANADTKSKTFWASGCATEQPDT